MKKKFILAVMILFIAMSFCACSNIVRSYETNEKSKYINDKTYKGGENSSQSVKLKKIWLNDLIGDNKVILNFSPFEKTPRHILTYNKNNKTLKLFLKNVSSVDTEISDAFSENKFIEDVEVRDNMGENTMLIIYLTKRDIEYRVDESKETNQLVLNLRE